MIKNKPEAYGISSDNLLCMVQELETFVEDIHSISVAVSYTHLTLPTT